jgi:hypothetical protein
MAFYQARANVCRAGVTYAGWAPPNIRLLINGTDRTSSVVLDGNFVLTLKADGTPATLNFTLKNLTPSVGNEIGLLFTGPNDYLFGGTLLQAEAVIAGTTVVLWHCTAVGYQWLLDRYDRVLARYASTGVGTMVADILARYTDGSFRVGYIPATLGNLDMDFTFETVTGALNRIAKASTAFWNVEPFDGVSRIVNLFDAYPQTAPATVTQASIISDALHYHPDLTQVRTRTLFQGSGSTVSTATAAGSATIPLHDLSPFLSAGGTAVAGRSLVTYTGITVGGGAGSLTGVSGLLDDLAAGDPVGLIVTTVDAAATTALATRLGGGLSGQATNYLLDGRLSATEAAKRGTTDLAVFDAPLEETSWTYKSVQRWLRVGQSVTVAITNPITVSGSFLIQTVTWQPYGVFGGTNLQVFQTVDASRYVRSMTDLLAQLPG